MFLRRILHQRFAEVKQSNEEPSVPPFHVLNVMPGGPQADYEQGITHLTLLQQHIDQDTKTVALL